MQPVAAVPRLGGVLLLCVVVFFWERWANCLFLGALPSQPYLPLALCAGSLREPRVPENLAWEDSPVPCPPLRSCPGNPCLLRFQALLGKGVCWPLRGGQAGSPCLFRVVGPFCLWLQKRPGAGVGVGVLPVAMELSPPFVCFFSQFFHMRRSTPQKIHFLWLNFLLHRLCLVRDSGPSQQGTCLWLRGDGGPGSWPLGREHLPGRAALLLELVDLP